MLCITTRGWQCRVNVLCVKVPTSASVQWLLLKRCCANSNLLTAVVYCKLVHREALAFNNSLNIIVLSNTVHGIKMARALTSNISNAITRKWFNIMGSWISLLPSYDVSALGIAVWRSMFIYLFFKLCHDLCQRWTTSQPILMRAMRFVWSSCYSVVYHLNVTV